jgi:hypothetical protein
VVPQAQAELAGQVIEQFAGVRLRPPHQHRGLPAAARVPVPVPVPVPVTVPVPVPPRRGGGQSSYRVMKPTTALVFPWSAAIRQSAGRLGVDTPG